MVAHHLEKLAQAGRLPRHPDQPCWIWDLTHQRVIWANDKGLAWNRVRSLEDLTCLRFAPTTAWVRRLAQLAKDGIKPAGLVQDISFAPGHQQTCLLEPLELDNKKTALVITFLEQGETGKSASNTKEDTGTVKDSVATAAGEDAEKNASTAKISKTVEISSKGASPAKQTRRKKASPKTAASKTAKEKTKAPRKTTTSRKRATKTTTGKTATGKTPNKTDRSKAASSKRVKNAALHSAKKSAQVSDTKAAAPLTSSLSDIDNIRACVQRHLRQKEERACDAASQLLDEEAKASTSGRNASGDADFLPKDKWPQPPQPYPEEDVHILEEIAQQLRAQACPTILFEEPVKAPLRSEISSHVLADNPPSSSSSTVTAKRFQGDKIRSKDAVFSAGGAGGRDQIQLEERAKHSFSPGGKTASFSASSAAARSPAYSSTPAHAGSDEKKSSANLGDSPSVHQLSADFDVLHIPARLPVAASFFDAAGLILESNELFHDLVGVTSPADKGHLHQIKRIFPQLELHELTRKGAKDTNHFLTNVLCKRLDGSLQRMDLRIQAQQGRDGKPLYLMIVQNISPVTSVAVECSVSGAEVVCPPIRSAVSSSQQESASHHILHLLDELKSPANERKMPSFGGAPQKPLCCHTSRPIGNDESASALPMASACHQNSPGAQPDIPFLSEVSHEMRTPLNSVIGFAELIQAQKLGPVGHPKYLGYIEDIHASAQQALHLINDLLDLSRFQAGAAQMQIVPLNLQTVLTGCLRALHPQIQAGALKVTVPNPAEDLMILADERLTRQVLNNVIGNAIKYSPHGGQITIWGRRRVSAGMIEVSITNSGPFLSKEDIEQALTPFGRLSVAEDSPTQGTGLGLPLAKSMMAAMQGNLALSSQPGPQPESSHITAHLTFPLAKEE